MSVRIATFRWCMLIGAAALLGVALYYGFGYIGLDIAVGNSGLKPFYQQTMRALWLGYCLQATLLGILFTVAALRPHWISRPLLIICGLLPLAEGVMALSFAGSYWLMILLFCAAVFILVGSLLWPTRPVPTVAVEPSSSPPPPPPFTSATAPPP